jgi:hypothetical protein
MTGAFYQNLWDHNYFVDKNSLEAEAILPTSAPADSAPQPATPESSIPQSAASEPAAQAAQQ